MRAFPDLNHRQLIFLQKNKTTKFLDSVVLEKKKLMYSDAESHVK